MTCSMESCWSSRVARFHGQFIGESELNITRAQDVQTTQIRVECSMLLRLRLSLFKCRVRLAQLQNVSGQGI